MIEEKGPWAAAFGNDKAFIESDDFTHDVRLYISGDFESIEHRVEYAEEIAKRLNTFARSTTHDKDKIIAAAKEADPGINEQTVDFLDEDGIEKLERFYAIAFEAGRQAEREECAAICDAFASGWEKSPGINPRAGFVASSNCAVAIRTRNTRK